MKFSKNLKRALIVAMILLAGMYFFLDFFFPVVILGGPPRYIFSLRNMLACKVFHPGKEYRLIGEDAWSTDTINGSYWCMSDNDIERFRSSHGP
ncbi:MAG: hypothetical protein WC813_01190 [Patescibacteria group bacterium]|jgi:hypothetical protein